MEITKTGQTLQVVDGSNIYQYPVDEVSIYRQGNDYIKIEAHKITNHTSVTNLAATSMDDLFNKLNLLIK